MTNSSEKSIKPAPSGETRGTCPTCGSDNPKRAYCCINNKCGICIDPFHGGKPLAPEATTKELICKCGKPRHADNCENFVASGEAVGRETRDADESRRFAESAYALLKLGDHAQLPNTFVAVLAELHRGSLSTLRRERDQPDCQTQLKLAADYAFIERLGFTKEIDGNVTTWRNKRAEDAESQVRELTAQRDRWRDTYLDAEKEIDGLRTAVEKLTAQLLTLKTP